MVYGGYTNPTNLVFRHREEIMLEAEREGGRGQSRNGLWFHICVIMLVTNMH